MRQPGFRIRTRGTVNEARRYPVRTDRSHSHDSARITGEAWIPAPSPATSTRPAQSLLDPTAGSVGSAIILLSGQAR